MNVIRYAARHARGAVWWAVVLSIVGGVMTAWIVALIGDILKDGGSTGNQMLLFAVLALGASVLRFVSADMLTRFSQRHLLDISEQLSRRVVDAGLRQVEELGPNRLLATLTEDLTMITGTIAAVPMIIANLAVFVGCLAYLAFLSWSLWIVVTVTMVAGIGLHTLVVRRADAVLRDARQERDALIGHYHALTDGFSELKLHRPRRQAFLSHTLRASLERISRLTISGLTYYNASANYSQLLFFIVVGVMVFGAAWWSSTPTATLTSAVLVMLYGRGPMDILVNWVPNVARAEVALRKYESVLAQLPKEHDAPESLRPVHRFGEIELAGVAYTYQGDERDHDRDRDGFDLGPIDLTLRPGEILFITGGNGSGKTTLAKIIAGLYVPTAGEIRIDGQTVASAGRDDYRQLFSCVFAKFHLFRELLGIDRAERDRDAETWLARMRLLDRVRVRDGAFSDLNLSTGQRKRVALLVAMLEERPICLFDEWAADQDPQYREAFYLDVLPELKARQKIVIVISHDDRYYDRGDRLIKLEEGKIVLDQALRTSGEELAAMVPRVARV